MSPKDVKQMWINTCIIMLEDDVVVYYNDAAVTVLTKDVVRVCYPQGRTIISDIDGLSLEGYATLLKERAYTCVLSDMSVIQVSYTLTRNQLTSHNLLYWPCPFEYDHAVIESIDDMIEMVSDYRSRPQDTEELGRLRLRSAIRIDYDPDFASEDHPPTHMTFHGKDVRIPVSRPMCINAFLKMIFQSFYSRQPNYERVSKKLHIQEIRDYVRYDECPSRIVVQIPDSPWR